MKFSKKKILKKGIKWLIIFFIIYSMLFTIFPTLAEDDEYWDSEGYTRFDLDGDVKFIKNNKSFPITGHEDIDILKIQSIDEFNERKNLTLKLTVLGKINNSENIEYRLFVKHYNDYYPGLHIFIYKNGSCFWYIDKINNRQEDILNYSIENSNTLNITIPFIKLGVVERLPVGASVYAETYEKLDNGNYFTDSNKPWFWKGWIIITEPFDGSTVFENCNINGVTNNLRYRNIKFVEIRIDSSSSVNWEKALTTNNWANWNYQWDINKVKDGKCTIQSRAFNGVEHYYHNITVYVDKQGINKNKTVDAPIYHVGDYYKYTEKNVDFPEELETEENIEIESLADFENYFIMEDNIYLNQKINSFDPFKMTMIGTDKIYVNGTIYDTYVFENKIVYSHRENNSIVNGMVRETSWQRKSNFLTIKREFEVSGRDVNGTYVYRFLEVETCEDPDTYTWYRYPLKVGDKWNSTVTMKITTIIHTNNGYYKIENRSETIRIINECLRTDTISVPAGKFDVFVILHYFYFLHVEFENESWDTWDDHYALYELGQINPQDLVWYFDGYSIEYYSPEISASVKDETYYYYDPYNSNKELMGSLELEYCKYGNKTYNPSSNEGFNIQLIRLVLVSSIIIFSMTFIISTEIGRFGFYSAIAPLYAKRRKKLNYDLGYIKGSVRGVIYANPGENYSTIKRILNIPNGTLTYYLRSLEKEGIIRSERDGFLKRFYPAEGMITTVLLELTDIQKEIYNVVKNSMGIFQKDIQSKLDISQQRLNYHIQLMINARLIKVEKIGKRSKYFVLDEIS